MVVISFLLVVLAAIALIIGLFQEGIAWIWASIGSCVLAMVFLGIGVLQRRSGPASTRAREGRGDEDEHHHDVAATVEQLTRDEGEGEAPDDGTVGEQAEGVADAPERTAEDAQRTDEEVGELTGAPPTPPPTAGPNREGAALEEERQEPAFDRGREGVPLGDGREGVPLDEGREEVPLDEEQAPWSVEPEAGAEAEPGAAEGREGATTGDAARAELAQVKGLGRAKMDRLLERFGSLEAIRAASVEEITAVKGVGPSTAQAIRGQPDGGPPRGRAGAEVAQETAGTSGATPDASLRDRLLAIRGVSDAKAGRLAERFGTAEAIRAASVEELTAVKGVGQATAERIRAEL